MFCLCLFFLLDMDILIKLIFETTPFWQHRLHLELACVTVVAEVHFLHHITCSTFRLHYTSKNCMQDSSNTPPLGVYCQ